MSKLIFDMQSGIAGDMTVAAALDLGIDEKAFIQELKKLPLEFQIEIKRVQRNGIAANHLHVNYPHQHIHRHLSHIVELINSSALDSGVKKTAASIFTRLGEAEAKVHGVSIDKVHFHEVGAVDAIVDITGASLAFAMLGLKEFYVTPFVFGTGTIQCDHGIFGIPAPATAELTRGFACRRLDVPGEMTTPTGAAIATTLAKPISALGAYRPIRHGYGAGTKELEGVPNVLRLTLCEESESCGERIVEMETNVDDATGEIVGRASEVLMKNGALDVYTIPIGMKKNRPGVLITVLCLPQDKELLSQVLLSETGSIGVRFVEKDRLCLPRSAGVVSTRFGDIKIKEVDVFGEKRVTPEYESCKEASDKHRVPVRIIYEEVVKVCK